MRESRGEGHATFIVTLPIHEAANALVSGLRRAEALLPIADRLTAVRVLVVEDDDDTRELLRGTAGKCRGLCRRRRNSQGRAPRAAGGPPDVLVSDIRMPEENGYSLVRSLRSAGVATPAIALTAPRGRQDAHEARAAGCHIDVLKWSTPETS